MSRDSYEPGLARALDAYEAPPLSAGFAGRVAAAATWPVQAKTVATPRDRRGGWARRRGAALGLLAAGLMSATAAAAGLFGDLGVTVPALERVVARIADDPPPAPAADPKPVVRKAAIERQASAEPVEAEPAAPPPPTVREVRTEVAARRIAGGIERRIARRERLGLPVNPMWKDPTVRMDPERAARFPERAALAERVQEIRRARRDGIEIEPLALPEGLIAPGPRPRLRDMTREERIEALRQWRELRRARRAMGDRPLEERAAEPDPDGEPR